MQINLVVIVDTKKFNVLSTETFIIWYPDLPRSGRTFSQLQGDLGTRLKHSHITFRKMTQIRRFKHPDYSVAELNTLHIGCKNNFLYTVKRTCILLQLMDYKSSVNKTTSVLDYLTRVIIKKCPHIAALKDDLRHVQKASRGIYNFC